MGDKKNKKDKKREKKEKKREKKREKEMNKKAQAYTQPHTQPLTMVRHTLRAGAALLGLGLSSYWGGRRQSLTALIPALVGGPLVALGGVALLSKKKRKKALTAAAVVAGVGFLGALRGPVQLIRNMRRGELPRSPLAVSAQTSMALICGKLCVRFLMASAKGDASD